MILTNKGSFSLYISLLAILFIFNSCEDPGSVGSDYVDSPDIRYDTLSVNQTQTLNYSGYSGRLNFMPMGYYSDPIFGELSANAAFKPILTPVVPDSVTLGNFTMQLHLSLDSLETYGDPESTSSFTLYSITEPWRGRTLKVDEVITYGSPVGTFSIEPDAKSVTVENLSYTWVSVYKEYFNKRDSANTESSYNNDFGGIIAVPDQATSKIEFAQVGTGNSYFNIINETRTDTIMVPFRDWGYTLERSQENLPQGTFALYSTLEGMAKVTMPEQAMKEDLLSRNILRADLVFYEADEELTTSLPEGHQRLNLNGVNLRPEATEDPAYQYQFGNISFFGLRNSDDANYKINVTNYVNNVLFGGENRNELILNNGSSTGVLRSTVLYNETAPEHLRPKIIITSLVD